MNNESGQAQGPAATRGFWIMWTDIHPSFKTRINPYIGPVIRKEEQFVGASPRVRMRPVWVLLISVLFVEIKGRNGQGMGYLA